MTKAIFGIALLIVAFSFSSRSISATSRIDNDYYAFKITQPFAVKLGGGWRAPDFKLSVGMVKSSFLIDARGMSGQVPAGCALVFVVDTTKHQPSKSKMPGDTSNSGAVGQVYAIKDNGGCIARIWLKSPQDYPDGAFGNIRKPRTSTYVVGLVQFQHGVKNSPFEIAIGANDLDSPRIADTGPDRKPAGNSPNRQQSGAQSDSMGRAKAAAALPLQLTGEKVFSAADVKKAVANCGAWIQGEGGFIPGNPLSFFHAVEILPSVSATSVGRGIPSKDGKAYPAKLMYRSYTTSNNQVFWQRGYLYRDHFGELICRNG